MASGSKVKKGKKAGSKKSPAKKRFTSGDALKALKPTSGATPF